MVWSTKKLINASVVLLLQQANEAADTVEVGKEPCGKAHVLPKHLVESPGNARYSVVDK